MGETPLPLADQPEHRRGCPVHGIVADDPLLVDQGIMRRDRAGIPQWRSSDIARSVPRHPSASNSNSVASSTSFATTGCDWETTISDTTASALFPRGITGLTDFVHPLSGLGALQSDCARGEGQTTDLTHDLQNLRIGGRGGGRAAWV